MDRVKREMTFKEEAKLYEEEARAEFAKETGNGDRGGVNNVLRRGMRIICKARQEIASREVVRCKDCKYWQEVADWCRACNQIRTKDYFCAWGERREGEGE